MAMPPLQLEESVVSRLVIEASPEHSGNGQRQSRLRTEVNVTQNGENPEKWQVVLNISVNPDEKEPGPYRIEIRMHGLFHVPGTRPRHEATRLLGVAGASILYSAAREHILMVTGRGPWGPLQLPTTTFALPELASAGATEARTSPVTVRNRPRGTKARRSRARR